MKPDDSEEVKKEKHDKLSGLRSEIVNGADFSDTASKHSDCPSKSQGGDLGFFSREMMVQPFSDAAFNLKTGGLSEIVETQFGYHLIKVTDHHEAGIPPLEQVKEDIKNFLGQQNQQQAFEKYIGELRKNSEIEYGEGYAPVPPTIDELSGEAK
jgi:peptidyl-prolyl cis-trans isomerase C